MCSVAMYPGLSTSVMYLSMFIFLETSSQLHMLLLLLFPKFICIAFVCTPSNFMLDIEALLCMLASYVILFHTA
uniref:Uncharacterized protein n=1 Tax=Arundo donax TaxID=35708 RepID=A0A0A9F1S1_ARUDO